MPLQTQPHEVSDFSGGFTDNYVDGNQNQCQSNDNLLVTTNRKLMSRWGSDIYDPDYPQIPPGAQRIGTLINRDSNQDLLIHSARNIYHIDSGWQTLTGPAGDPVFDSGTTANKVSFAEWNKHLYLTNDDFSPLVKIFKDGSGTFKVRSAGLPAFPSLPTITAGAAGANNYIYAFVWFYEYTVENMTFQDFSAPLYKELVSSAAPNVSANSISAIPVLAPTSNYDTANIKVKIYRTIAAGQTLYYVGQVTNGTTVFSDNVSDATLQSNELLYTTGDVSPNDPPPLCKFIHITRDIAWFAYIKEGSEIMPNRIRQSIPGDPDSSPEDFYVDVEGELMGMSSVGGVPIALCKRGIHRLDGNFDELGRGEVVPKNIGETVGCVSNESIVQTQQGIFWAGLDGFYFSDGVKCLKISNHLNTSYKALVKTEARARNIVGSLDPDGNRIQWAVQRLDASLDNDSTWVLDLRWGIKEDSCFSSASGGDSFAPTAITFYNGDLIRADKRGYIFKHNETYRSDPTVDTNLDPDEWATQAIIFDYRSCALNYGTSFVRKWVPKIVVSARNEGNLALQIRSNNDDSGVFRDLAPIRFQGAFEWGEPEFTWGDPNFIWNYNGMIEEIRRFPAKGLRCSHKQIQITNAFTTLAASSDNTLGTVDSVAKTVVLPTGAYTWSDFAVGWYISFENDDYTNEYLITERTDDTLTYQDSSSSSVSGPMGWRLRGYPKNEIIHLLGYVIHYAYMSASQKAFRADSEGGAAWNS